ncbi:DUF397 domain-containing protein [Kitasatospora sp. NBC_01266]|uniref:DUF397 domain-containing protein n=1 Tax=Kitasatospora sp. NBC_01266 TaxID=2903572 RepID=UPI002E2EF657|nr:DUF397 domain-containing protein [Kitasatospora sp. NBC_01266]
MTTSPDVIWRKSSYSNGQGAECVEVANGLTTVVPVRDSKDPLGPALSFPAPGWSAFITELKADHSPLR